MQVKISGNYTVVPSAQFRDTNNQELFLECQTSLGPVNITLPAISAFLGFHNIKIYVNDLDGMAGTNPITIITNPVDRINSALTSVLNQDGASDMVAISGDNDWFLANKSTALESWVKVGSIFAADLNVGNSKVFVGGKPINKYINQLMTKIVVPFVSATAVILPGASAATTPAVTTLGGPNKRVTSGLMLSTLSQQEDGVQDLSFNFLFVAPPNPMDWSQGQIDIYVVYKDFIA